MADFYFKPRKVINNRGQQRNINNLKSYYGFVRNNAKIYFGETSEKNLINSEIPHIDVTEYNGGDFSSKRIATSDDKMDSFTERHTNAGLKC